MLWSSALLLVFAGLAVAEYGWDTGYQYVYNLEARTVAGLHQVADQYSGTFVHGKLNVYVESDNTLTFQIKESKYADFNQHFSEGWATDLYQSKLSYKGFPIKNDVFKVYLKNGVVEKLVIDKDAPHWEVNFIKSIVSQFQVDVHGQNLKKFRYNALPTGQHHTGLYKTMEDSVNGKYETIYEVSVLPDYIIQSQPELAPLPHLSREGEFYNVIKTRNFSSSEKHVIYRYGFNGHEGWKAGTNQMGNFLSRTSESRIVLSGKLYNYTIQSSVTTEKVIIAPHLYNSQKGIVASRMNLTLEEYSSFEGSVPTINSPKTFDDLVYEYEYVEPQGGGSSEESSSSSSPDSSESSSSSSEEHDWNQSLKRKTRSPLLQYGSSSSSSESSSSSSSSSSEESSEIRSRIRRGAPSAETEYPFRPLRGIKRKLKPASTRDLSPSSSSSSSSSSESSSISSEEYIPPQPDIDDIPQIEFFPDQMVYSNSESGLTVEQIVRLARKIGKFLENPSNIPKDNVLTYYSMLSHLTAGANSQQLEQATEKLYYPHEKIQGSAKEESYYYYRSWLAYRDAVAQAGTGPALITIFNWVKSGKIWGYEAAQVFAVIPKAARYPTTEYMDYFFGMVRNNLVRNQKYLNDSAILSFSDLVRRSQVDKKSSHQRYPLHYFGTKALTHFAVVIEKYIPYLQGRFMEAVQQGDSIKIQVYIRALTNIGHPTVWVGLEPFFEGKYPISDFQRLTMIAYLGDMIKVHPNTVRSILYKVYQNEGDVPAIRVAAVMQLMKTNPPPQMLQRMAEFTNYDHSEHVNAAVKSAIESAANGEFQTYPELTKNARSAANLLTSKNYGFEYSQNFIKSYIAKEYYTLEYQHYLTYIQGLDGIYPSSVLYNLQRKIGGYVHEPQTISFMSSSSEELLNLLFGKLGLGKHQTEPHHKPKMAKQTEGKQSSSEYSYQKIKEILDGQFDEPVQVEGNIFFSFFGAPRFFAFDNHTIEKFPQYIKQIHQSLQKGVNFHETKYYNQYSVEIGFPLATGVPFIYSYEEPTLFFFDVEAKGHLQKQQGEDEYYKVPYDAYTEGTYKFAWSSQKRGKLGFVSPFSNQKYLAVVEKNTQFYVPFEGSLQFNGPQKYFQATIKPYTGESSEQQKIFQHKTGIYTTYHNLYDIKPYIQGSYAKHVHVASNRQFKKSFGKAYSGYDFQVEAESENNFSDYFNLYKAFKSLNFDFISSAFYHDLVHTMAKNYYAVSYDPRTSGSPQKVVFKFSYDSIGQGSQHKKNSNVMNVRDKMTDVSGSRLAQPSSFDNRVEEMFAHAYSGIQDAKTQVFDASVSFQGSQNKGHYAFKFAHAESPVSEKSRYIAYFSASPYQESKGAKAFKIGFQVNFKDAQVPVFNYKQAFEADPTSYVQGKVDFSDDDDNYGTIMFQGKFEQTEERKNYVKNSPYSALCEKQMEQNNYIQPACRNASLNANALDKYQFTFKYENVPEEIEQLASAAYGFARHYGYHYNSEEYAGVNNEEGTIKFGFKLSEDLSKFNFSIEAPHFNSQFENIGLHHQLRPFFVKNPAYNQLYFYSPYYFYSKNYETCAVDDNLVTTFNNHSYPINFGDEYYVLAYSIPHGNGDSSEESVETYSYYLRDFAVIAKEYGSKKKEVQILLGDEKITLHPSGSDGVTVTANGEMIQLSENKVSKWKKNEIKFKAFSLPGGNNAVLYFKNHGFQVFYDGGRVLLSALNHHRNRLRGICGTYDGEPTYDFTTPSNCVLKDPQEFVASYAVPETPFRSAKEHKHRASSSACYQKRVVYTDVMPESDFGTGRRPYQTMSGGNNIHGQHSSMSSSCSSYKIQIVKDSGKSCFSIRPQVSCNAYCKPSKHLEKLIDFHCLSDTDNMTGRYLRMVEKGAHPDLTQKSPNAKMMVSLPESCISS